jgi:hypothetical protein
MMTGLRVQPVRHVSFRTIDRRHLCHGDDIDGARERPHCGMARGGFRRRRRPNQGDGVMKIAISLAAALALFTCAPAFAHGGGMGHMGGNMGGNMGNMTGNHNGDYHNPPHGHYSKTTKTDNTYKTHTTRRKHFKYRKVVRVVHTQGKVASNTGTHTIGYTITHNTNTTAGLVPAPQYLPPAK